MSERPDPAPAGPPREPADLQEPLAPDATGPGAHVRHAREAAGLTLEQVSDRTKIRPAVLRDLEAGSVERSGGPAYARGHLRAVASATGCDPDVLLAAFDRSGGGRSGPVAGAAALRLPVAARESRRPRWGAAAAAAALLLTALMVIGALSGGGADPAPTAAPSSVSPPVATTPAPPQTVALRLRVSGAASWVSVLTSGGTSLFTGMLSAGAAREFHDPTRLQVVLGNAGAVTVGCAGKDTAAGARGQVRRYTCATTGLSPA